MLREFFIMSYNDGVLAMNCTLNKGKEIRGIRIEMKETELSLFAVNMITDKKCNIQKNNEN